MNLRTIAFWKVNPGRHDPMSSFLNLIRRSPILTAVWPRVFRSPTSRDALSTFNLEVLKRNVTKNLALICKFQNSTQFRSTTRCQDVQCIHYLLIFVFLHSHIFCAVRLKNYVQYIDRVQIVSTEMPYFSLFHSSTSFKFSDNPKVSYSAKTRGIGNWLFQPPWLITFHKMRH